MVNELLRLMDTDMEKLDGDGEILNCNVVGNRASENCRCNELKERSRKAEARCAELEFELQSIKNDFEALETKFKALQVEKFAIEDELKVLKKSSEGLHAKEQVSGEGETGTKTVIDLTEEEDKIVQLMIENKVLECEKKKAENEVEVWKDKYKKLESCALQLRLGRASLDCHEGDKQKQESNWIKPEGNSCLGTSFDILQNQEKVVDLANVASSSISPDKKFGDMQSAGTPSNDMYQSKLDSEMQPGRRVRKQLKFETEGSPSKKMAPSTPIGAKSDTVNVIDITDSDDEPNITQQPVLDGRGISVSTYLTEEKEKMSENSFKGVSFVQNCAVDLNVGEDVLFVATPKRKRTCNVVMSESERDDDDNVPIYKLKRMHIQAVSPDQGRCDLVGIVTPKRRLLPLRKCVNKSQGDKKSSGRSCKAKQQQSIPTNEDTGDHYSDCESGSLSDFIVDDSDVSGCQDTSSESQDVSDGDMDFDSGNSQNVPDSDMESDFSNSEDASDGDMDFSKILSKIRRNKDHKRKWEFEADMLAAFGKDHELCMKAVCALYRQQTSEEQMSKGTLYNNQRGFSKFDASRGSALAEFLTDGDPCCDLKKSVKELEEYDPKGVELCRTLAIHYSKQLFEIYKNKEDHLFT